MRPLEVVVQRLDRDGYGPRGNDQKGYEARCPGHDDSNPSLSVSEGRDGKVIIHCHAGCDGYEVIAALGLEWGDLFPPEPEPRRVPQAPAREVKAYTYTDEQGQPLFQVVRMEPKSFRQRRWENGRWVWGLGETRRVLYRLPEIQAALARGEVVFVVEGEKDADALVAAGFQATTLPGGAGKWRPEYSDMLAGTAHRVYVIGDDDAVNPKNGRREGHVHAADVWRALQGKVGQVAARLPAEGYKDVADQLAAGVPFESATLRRIPMLEAVPPPTNGHEPSGPLMLTAKAMAARASLGKTLQVVGPLFQRGMRTTIGAGTGEGKTTFALQAIRALIERKAFLSDTWVPPTPGRALIIDLEQGEETLKKRLREAGLAETEAVDVLWEPAGLALDQDAAHQALVRDTIAAGGYDMVLVDPLYQMHRGNANDERLAADLMRVVDAWSREFQFSLVIPMHARKPHPLAGTRFTLADIAGSGSWNRNAEFVFGLQMMSAGHSKLHFFKDRQGDEELVGKHWWLAFDRQHGFARTFKEDKDAVRRSLNEMLAADDGATEDELAAAGADEVWLKGMKKRAYVNGEGRWRKADWNEQTTLATDPVVT